MLKNIFFSFRRLTAACLLLFSIHPHAFGQCSEHDSADATYQVVAPVGHQTVEMMTMAPRLTTLEGKTIALVGGSFMASVTHMELKKLILSHYPTAKVYLLDEIGSAGLYPAPGVQRRSVSDFQQRLKNYGVDAVIAGNGGCGICTPKETGSAIAAEYIGIPAVMVAAPSFTEQAKVTALNNGIPALRVATYPGAFASHTDKQLVENTRNVLWQQVVSMLTTDITQQEKDANTQLKQGDVREVVFDGTLEEVNQFFNDMSWSDGMPVIPPTQERINSFLRFTDSQWDDVVAVLSPAYRQTLVWHVAANGVMAGCKPEYMPILIALTKAMSNPLFRRTLASTHAWIPYCWVNGPVARQLGFDNGQGQINEAANVALGRFLNLAMQNLAGYYVKQDRMGTFGYPVSWCLAEDEAACMRIGWVPYHVRQGYPLNASTVTAASALLWGNNMAPATTDGEQIMQLLAWDITQRSQLALGSGMQYTYRTILMTEEVAQHLKSTYHTLGSLEDQLVATARRPLYERTYAHYYANPGSNINPDKISLEQYMLMLQREEQAAMTPTPQWVASDDEQILTIPTMQKGETAFLITGDASRNKIQTMPGGGMATEPIALPAAWDALMAELGYPPLASLYFTEGGSTDGHVAAKPGAAKPENAPVRTDYFDKNNRSSSSPNRSVHTRRNAGNGDFRPTDRRPRR